MRKQKVFALISNTFQKEYRSKTLIFLLIFTLMIVFLINAFMDIFLDPMEKHYLFIPGMLEKKLTAFYFIISLWGGFLATLLGVNCVRSDFEHNVASQILSFPIKKIDYLLSRISGTWLIVMGYYLFSLLFAFFIFSFSNRDWTFGLHIPLALLVNGLGLLTLITLGVFFSLFFSKLLSFLGVFFLAGLVSASNTYFLNKDLELMKLARLGIYEYLLTFLHFLFPRLGTINTVSRAILLRGPLPENTLMEGLHFLGTFILLWIPLIWVFRKKEHSTF